MKNVFCQDTIKSSKTLVERSRSVLNACIVYFSENVRVLSASLNLNCCISGTTKLPDLSILTGTPTMAPLKGVQNRGNLLL